MGAMLPPVPAAIRGLAGAGQDVVQSGRQFSLLERGLRVAKLIASEAGAILGFDTIANVPTLPEPRGASFAAPYLGIVHRGGALHLNQAPQAEQFDGVYSAPTWISVLQGSTLKAKASRTQTLVMDHGFVGGRYWACYTGSEALSPTGDNQPPTFIVAGYSTNILTAAAGAATFTEAVQWYPADATYTPIDSYMLAAPSLGRLFIFFSHNPNSRNQGLYVSEILNPLATTGFVVSPPQLVGVGRAQFGTEFAGQLFIGIDNSQALADNPVEAGQYFCRFWPSNGIAPHHLEKVGPVTNIADTSKWVASEASYVPLTGGRILMTRRSTVGSYSAISTDGGRTWPAPTAYATAALTEANSARTATRRSPSGRLARVLNNNASRQNMRLCLSEDEGATWPYQIEIIAGRSQYPAIAFSPDGTKILVGYDEDRGVAGAKNIKVSVGIVDEAALVAGSATVTTQTLIG